jgi:hypothetical protein
MTSIPLSDIESSASAKFVAIGDKYAGRITNITERQQTDPVNGAVKTWQDGTPRMVWVITIEQADGETVAFWARGGKFKAASGSGESMLSAIGTAVRTAGAGSVDIGGQLALAHTGLAEQATPGFTQAKLFTAQYVPPAPVSVPVDLFAS